MSAKKCEKCKNESFEKKNLEFEFFCCQIPIFNKIGPWQNCNFSKCLILQKGNLGLIALGTISSLTFESYSKTQTANIYFFRICHIFGGTLCITLYRGPGVLFLRVSPGLHLACSLITLLLLLSTVSKTFSLVTNSPSYHTVDTYIYVSKYITNTFYQ